MEERSFLVSDIYLELIKGRVVHGEGNVFVILAGVPYSGKSTVSKLFVERGFVHFWTTVVKKKYALTDEEVFVVAEEVCERLLREGYDVVFDFLNHTAVLRERFILIAKRAGRDYRVVFLDTDKEELFRRQEEVMKQEGSDAGRSKISKEVIELILNELEIPHRGEEGVIFVKNGDDSEVERWFSRRAI